MELSILTYDEARACHILRLKQGPCAAETFATTLTVCSNPRRVVRSLDTIHLAAAQLVSPELDALITYDRRMAEAAWLLGVTAQSPE